MEAQSRAREACLGNGKWTSLDALDGLHGGALANKMNKNVWTPGPKEYLILEQYSALWGF